MPPPAAALPAADAAGCRRARRPLGAGGPGERGRPFLRGSRAGAAPRAEPRRPGERP